MAAGGMSALPLGIPAVEMQAAAQLVGVRRRDWLMVSSDVAAMGRIAADAVQKRARSK